MESTLQSVAPGEVLAQVDFGSFRNPDLALREAEMVAKAFARRAEQLQLYKTIGTSKHLLIEGWQMLGSMYRVTASITSTRYCDYGNVTGWEATAEAIYVPTGMRISQADAMCLSDEDNWGPRPKYEWTDGPGGKRQKKLVGTVPTPTQQLRSMAQTRACSKVYSNLLKFVARMAGFAGTPAEELTGHEDTSDSMPPKESQQPRRASEANGGGNGGGGNVISEAQAKRFYSIWKNAGKTKEQAEAILKHFGFESDRDITRDKYEAICTEAGKGDAQ